MYFLREANYEIHQIISWTDPDDSFGASASKCNREFGDQMAAFGSFGYVNVNSDEHNAIAGSTRLLRLYGGNLSRLLEVKRVYDPTNLFHHNANIRVEGTALTHSAIKPEEEIPVPPRVLPTTSLNARSQQRHLDTACDACGMCPIVGVRYKCGNCSNYDLCETCEGNCASFHHDDHVFIKIVRPAKVSMHALDHGFIPNLYKTGKSGLPTFELSFPAQAALRSNLPVQLSDGKTKLKHVSRRDISDLSSAVPTLRSPDRAMLTGANLAETLMNIFNHYASDSPGRPCIGKRNGSSFSFLSYGEVLERFLRIGAAISEICFVRASTAPANEQGKRVVAILAPTSVDAVICDLACASQGLSPVFIPFNVSSLVVAELLSSLGCNVAMCANQSASLLSAALSSSVSCAVQLVIAIDGCENSLHLPPSISLRQLRDIEARGAALFQEGNLSNHQPRFSDLFTLIYTSGSSGLPKGAVRSCRQWHDLMVYFTQGVDSKRAEHVVCAYAPLCHIMERSNVWSSFALGGCVGVFDRHASELLDDVKLLSPTVFAATPSVWNTLFAQYQQSIETFRTKHANSSAADIRDLALASMSSALGSRVRSISTGGAVTSQEVLEFMRACFKCEVADAYGITETGPVLVNGLPLPGVEIKLEDVHALGYLVDARPSSGHLLVRTSNMAEGYFNVVESCAFQRDGWYATGDIVQIGDNGRVVVVDRISNCFKLSHGEFISPEKVESALISCSWVDQAYVYGDSFKNFLVAIIVLNTTMLHSRARASQLRDLSPESLGALREEVASDIAAACTALLLPYELPKTYVLVDYSERFTADNRLLTATLKLNRANLKRHFSAEIGATYASIESRYLELVRMVNSLLPCSDRAMGIAQLPADVDLSFVMLGGDSLSAIKFVNLIREQFGKQLSPDVLLRAKSLQDIYTHINQPGPGNSDIVSEAEAVAHDRALTVPCCLPSSADRIATADSRHIFLTGATGFLGANVLSILLQRSCATIHCLVRRNTLPGDSMPLQRIVDAFVLYRLEPLDTSRIQIVQGDLSLPSFGLSPSVFERLSCSVDCVFHVGAHVNWLLDYRSARAPNVQGTHTVLTLATSGRPKTLHYCSTISVACGNNEDDALSEAHLRQLLQSAYNGYGVSKWIAEEMVWRASAKGLPTVVYRPGMITGHTQTGACNASDFVSRLIAGVAVMGHYPESSSKLDTTPVDFVASAFVRIAMSDLQPGVLGRCFHLVNSSPMSVAALCKAAAGTLASPMPYQLWQRAITERKNPLQPLAAFLPPGSDFSASDFSVFSTANTDRVLATPSGCHACPPASAEHIAIQAEYLLAASK
jgi:fatty acid CoA ligase FadD9